MESASNSDARATCGTSLSTIRPYRKSKRMKQKAAKQRKPAASPDVPAAIAQHGAASICTAHTDHRRVRFAPDTKGVSRLPTDDFLHAFQVHGTEEGHVLHIDHAHSIAVGEKGEKYFLMMVIDGKDFMWATSSRHTSSPELLLEDFLRGSC
mmetsp:Transcript_4659/g.9294  ORF Transcript_4659/g.9294 Transcript_4659/m.9294 type:complete len:152 (-) Transcript_4659:87-542(-)